MPKGKKENVEIHYKRVRGSILCAVYIIYTNPRLTNIVLFMIPFVICRNLKRSLLSLKFKFPQFLNVKTQMTEKVCILEMFYL